MKPRIIILLHYLELGGAESALIGLLQAMNPELVYVDLFLYSHQGPLMRFIPQWINLLPEVGSYSAIEKPISAALRQGQLKVCCARLLARIKHKHCSKQIQLQNVEDISLLQYIGDSVTPVLPHINPNVEYDLCISFLIPHNIGIYKVRAKRKMAWIHTDYNNVAVNSSQELPVWGAYDYIASISEDVGKSFLRFFPSLRNKLIEIENVLSAEMIHSRAHDFNATIEMNLGVKILSIGRYCYQKNFDNVPDICRRLRELGVNATWYLIGYGGDEALIRQKIAIAGMEEHVILLGKKENPYPYISACDVYVQPSRYEGKSVTVREAQILGKPVVVTNYPTASSQISDGVDGVIVPLDNQGCADGIAEFIRNAQLQKSIVEHLSTHDFSGETEVEKIYKLLEI